MQGIVKELEEAAAQGRPALDVILDLSIRLRQVGSVLNELSRGVEENLQELEVLGLLHRLGAPHRTSPAQLLRSLSITSGALTGRLDNLESQGCIRRERGVRDRRQLFVELTVPGLDRIVAARQRLAHLDLGALGAKLSTDH